MHRSRIAAFAAAAITLGVLAPAGADEMAGMKMDKARFSDVTSYTGAPNLPLTLDVVVAGGGPKDYDTTKLLGVLAGSLTAAEVKSLTEKYGAESVRSFITTFDFVIGDALKIVTEKKIALPAKPQVDPADGKAIAAALYHAGTTKDGAFDVEYLLDNLVSHPIHVQIMDDIDKKFSRKADANYHIVLTQAMLDLKTAYKL